MPGASRVAPPPRIAADTITRALRRQRLLSSMASPHLSSRLARSMALCQIRAHLAHADFEDIIAATRENRAFGQYVGKVSRAWPHFPRIIFLDGGLLLPDGCP